MSLITWNNSYSVGVREIDSQHQKLVELANRTHEAMKRGAVGAELNLIVQDLIAYTVEHFAHEEAMMARSFYPDMADHKRRHTAMSCHVVELQQQLEAGKATAALHLQSFLKDWLMKHILETDKAFGLHLQRHKAA